MFGAEAYRGVAWQTPDHVIPFRVFFALWEHIPAIVAGESLDAARAVQMGSLLADNPKQAPLQRVVRQLERQSLPFIDTR